MNPNLQAVTEIWNTLVDMPVILCGHESFPNALIALDAKCEIVLAHFDDGEFDA